MTIDYLHRCLEEKTPVQEAIHERMRQLLLQYCIVGGMPRAVSIFMETHNMQNVLRMQQAIIEEYKVDMLKYAPQADKSRIRECFESIPRQLSKENKKFAYATVRPNGRGRDYQGSLQWIEDAGIIRRCYNLSAPELPLDGNSIPDQFKVYMADTGLSSACSNQERQLTFCKAISMDTRAPSLKIWWPTFWQDESQALLFPQGFGFGIDLLQDTKANAYW